LAQEALKYAGERRGETWPFMELQSIRGVHEPLGGITRDTAKSREPSRMLEQNFNFMRSASRAEIIARVAYPECHLLVGDYRQGVSTLQALAEEYESHGWLVWAATSLAIAARFNVALGEFTDVQEARRRAAALAKSSAEPWVATVQLLGAEDEFRLAMDENWDAPLESVGPGMGHGRAMKWYQANVGAVIARTHAHMGRVERAIRRLGSVLPAIEHAPGWTETYITIVCNAAATLWLTERTDHINVIERNLREKVIEPDFRFPMMDGRLTLARLSALQQRHDEAVEWFAKARAVLDEQSARPLRAITDFDEAWMYLRRGVPGDRERAASLLDAALQQFRALGMTGWIRRAERLKMAGGPEGPSSASG